MVKVKVCGITNLKDAIEAVKAGADYLGFVLYPKSPRYIKPEKVGEIVGNLPKKVPTVAVVVNGSPEKLIELFDLGFDYIQLHGDEGPEILNYLPPSQVIKAFRVKDSLSEELLKPWEGVFAFLLDTYKRGVYGGTGETFNWEVAKGLPQKGYKIFLSGGLNPENVEEAISSVRPYAVDVSSGVELTKGKKDLKKLKEFILRAKGVRVDNS
ncbi:MAG TPA: phosphoribosylanthranilate isomerase [Aquifex aeolicus]|nr:phosphoribosylanthranilate isomerase [Aquificales bacterium]HIP86121.1 phosphoribosylanthranilate isomerase [Aquifex sp.]HIQ26758.1 phosphoribosylanthranilate isomerase [Aquifex aeolicus]